MRPLNKLKIKIKRLFAKPESMPVKPLKATERVRLPRKGEPIIIESKLDLLKLEGREVIHTKGNGSRLGWVGRIIDINPETMSMRIEYRSKGVIQKYVVYSMMDSDRYQGKWSPYLRIMEGDLMRSVYSKGGEISF